MPDPITEALAVRTDASRPQNPRSGANATQAMFTGAASAGAVSAGAASAGGASLPHAEVGGPQGPEPTRYGDWERRGRCIDF